MNAADLLRHWVFGHRAPHLFRKGLQKEIKETLGVNPKPLLAQIRERAHELAPHADFHGHVELTAHVLAAYQILQPHFGIDKLTVTHLKQAMMRGVNTRGMRLALRLALFSCRHNPDRFYSLFGWLMRQYGATFDWEAPHVHKGEKCAFSFTIKRCFYHEFFKAHNVPFLTPILCQLDALWFNMVDPKRHGFTFDKSHYQTQGYGADTCRFPIITDR